MGTYPEVVGSRRTVTQKQGWLGLISTNPSFASERIDSSANCSIEFTMVASRILSDVTAKK